MPFTPTDYLPYDFANRRHIGPSPAEMAEMFVTLGVKDLDALIDETVPASIRQSEPLDFGKPRSEREVLYELRVIADKNQVYRSLIGPGLSRHRHPAGDPAQHPRKPRLVHRLHPLPARDQPGPAGGAAQLPDDDLRPHRAGGRQRLAA